MCGEGVSWPPDYCLLVFISGDSLTEADFSFSATRFPEVAAAVLEILQLYPVIPHQKPELPVPRGRALEVGEKGPGAGAVPAFLTHNLYSCRLALGLRRKARHKGGCTFLYVLVKTNLSLNLPGSKPGGHERRKPSPVFSAPQHAMLLPPGGQVLWQHVSPVHLDECETPAHGIRLYMSFIIF